MDTKNKDVCGFSIFKVLVKNMSRSGGSHPQLHIRITQGASQIPISNSPSGNDIGNSGHMTVETNQTNPGPPGVSRLIGTGTTCPIHLIGALRGQSCKAVAKIKEVSSREMLLSTCLAPRKTMWVVSADTGLWATA